MRRLRFATLGSGSRGNATVIACGRTVVLMDCGFAVNETLRRLGALGLSGEDLSAIVVTHEHGDHMGGVARLARRFKLPVWLTAGTYRGGGAPKLPDVRLFNPTRRSRSGMWRSSPTRFHTMRASPASSYSPTATSVWAC